MRITLIGTGFPSMNQTPQQSRSQRTTNTQETKPKTNTSNNPNDLDIPPFLRK